MLIFNKTRLILLTGLDQRFFMNFALNNPNENRKREFSDNLSNFLTISLSLLQIYFLFSA